MTKQQRGPEAPTVWQSAIVELVFGVVGLGLIVVTGQTFEAAFAAPVPPPLGAAGGIFIGAALGGAFGFGVTRKRFAWRVRPFLARFTSSRPTTLNFALLGLAAALGEETLFRAAVQPVAGIVVAAVLFTLAHALIADFRHPTPGKAAYAGLALGMGILLGLLYERFGIAGSMGAHFAFDTTALILVRPLLPGAATDAISSTQWTGSASVGGDR
jgi:CAAX protease family protein